MKAPMSWKKVLAPRYLRSAVLGHVLAWIAVDPFSIAAEHIVIIAWDRLVSCNLLVWNPSKMLWSGQNRPPKHHCTTCTKRRYSEVNYDFFVTIALFIPSPLNNSRPMRPLCSRPHSPCQSSHSAFLFRSYFKNAEFSSYQTPVSASSTLPNP